MLNVITIAEAQRLIAEKFGQLRMPEEHVPLVAALWRVLARDCLATESVSYTHLPLPPFYSVSFPFAALSLDNKYRCC